MSEIIDLSEVLREGEAADRLALINAMPLRFSQLKRMNQSPAHYAAAVDPSSSAIDIGSAADTLILGGAQRVIPYTASPQRRGKVWDQFKADNPDALILTPKEYRAAEGMARAVSKSPDAMRFLNGAIRELCVWTIQGRSCRGTPDVWNEGAGFITDLKTGETSDPRRFPWKVRSFAYHAQLAWYQDGLELAGYDRPRRCYIVAVEQSPPHVVTVYVLTEHILDLGRRLCRLWFEQVRICEQSGHWPGYSQSVVELDLPEFEDGGELLEMEAAGTPSDE